MGGGCHDFHLVSVVQGVAELDVSSVYLCAYAPASQVGMDGEGEIEHGSSLRQLVEVALGAEHEHFVFIQVEFELVDGFGVSVRVFQGLAYGVQPFVQSCFAFDAFVPPVCGKSFFSYFVHPFGTYLYFHPFAFGTHYGDVERFVSVAFGYGKPVAEPLGVGQVHVGYDRICLPAFLLFLIEGRVEDDAYGK